MRRCTPSVAVVHVIVLQEGSWTSLQCQFCTVVSTWLGNVLHKLHRQNTQSLGCEHIESEFAVFHISTLMPVSLLLRWANSSTSHNPCSPIICLPWQPAMHSLQVVDHMMSLHSSFHKRWNQLRTSFLFVHLFDLLYCIRGLLHNVVDLSL